MNYDDDDIEGGFGVGSNEEEEISSGVTVDEDFGLDEEDPDKDR